ncbi:quinone-dependent dihydroorotate dehydrogenase [Myxococcus sp. MISCRS1]|jgi:dihydroorotate dehydrogenase|uniref:quinone-dependent dihydroorotate dehydrogenase n=1 Tax=Myxococcus TaxID=32 RepID=UPI001CBC53E9|nr:MULTISPECIES: quinone-dependent dihydroorotate dehydrogenase [unclassified Myxococcus]MBZ4399946.1 quinone-dependent dihydroorotate dehydrogenase [Myxococcus sp. AS-1-15]MBZ4414239.1 quinone-dependent dihydroorotate dehydrogenase [Myxococcus sp. XM-1-1-1]MCY0996002.1 quinone-dependent dihydroorotate dehydrogenase [Myxococcus sp. MISCRS1]
MYGLTRSLLFKLDAERAHRLGLWGLRQLGHSRDLCESLRERALEGVPASLAVEVAGLRFAHPVALAAGLDKDAEAVDGLFACGFSAVEVGTVTPRPQPGNPTPRLFRLPEHQAVINRMGFNNHGAAVAAQHLRARTWHPGPVGVNLGKNKDTPLERAVEDYVACVDALGPLGDYVVVNASSPNTPGLRKLQEPEVLSALLGTVRARLDTVAPGKPLFLKIAPDLTPEAVDEVVDVALAQKLAGLIATNTTVARPFEHPLAKEAGGLSGAPVREASNAVIARAYQRSGGKLPIIGVGGVFTAADVFQKLRAGASLVQVYTGFIYEGPGMVRGLLPTLAQMLERDGYQSVAQLVGADHRGDPGTVQGDDDAP